MMLSLTGTPGTGKTSASRCLEKHGFRVISVNDLALDRGCAFGRDEARDTVEVDVQFLRSCTIPHDEGDNIVLEGHLAHFMDADIVVVFRTSPAVIKERLSARNWSEAKVKENMEAEACDVILMEAMEQHDRVYEVDTTNLSPEEAAECVLAIVSGEVAEYMPGNIDWSEEVLSWY